ncbi:MAG: hypothetical protein AB8G18_06300 [Gammaproteobacteria bacterium]
MNINLSGSYENRLALLVAFLLCCLPASHATDQASRDLDNEIFIPENVPSSQPNLPPIPFRGPTSGDIELALLDELTSTSDAQGSMAYVAEVDARYQFSQNPVTDADGWGAVNTTAAINGSWTLVSDSLSISPLGNDLDDWQRFLQAATATAQLGIPLELENGTWLAKTLINLPTGLDLIMNPQTIVRSMLTPDITRVDIAPFVAKPGFLVLATTVATPNEFGSAII